MKEDAARTEEAWSIRSLMCTTRVQSLMQLTVDTCPPSYVSQRTTLDKSERKLHQRIV